jgi:hypothetical protein
MKLSEILERAAYPRTSWDAGLRRGHFPFMQRDIAAGMDRYTDGHYLAFRTCLLLRSFGLEARLAGEAVNASFGVIRSVADGQGLPPTTSHHAGVRMVLRLPSADLVPDLLGWPNADLADAPEVGRVSVDFVKLAAVLATLETCS